MLFDPVPPDALARKVMASFGYPNFAATQTQRTASGGTSFRQGGILLVLDREGVPRTLKVSGVPFQPVTRAKFKARITPLLRRYPLRLPTGEWQTEDSIRYAFVPVAHGYPMLNVRSMTVQLSRDGKRVIEWLYHPTSLSSFPTGKRPMSRAKALDTFDKIAQSRVAGAKNASSQVEAKKLRLGWLHSPSPRLVYTCLVWRLRHNSMGTKGVGETVTIDAVTGSELRSAMASRPFGP